MAEVDRAQLRRVLRTPNGRIALQDVNLTGSPRSLFQEIVGSHVHVLEFTGAELVYTHATPGSATWRAALPVSEIPERDRAVAEVWLAWSHSETEIAAISPHDRRRAAVVRGERADMRVAADRAGSVLTLGSGTITARVHIGGQEVSAPSSLELWSEVRLAIGHLLQGRSEEGYVYELVSSNAALTMLATGFEGYCERRFVELEGEGVLLDAMGLLARIGAAEERQEIASGGRPVVLSQIAVGEFGSAEALVGRLNFQNYDRAKLAFNKGYGLRFGADLEGVTNTVLERIKRLLHYRHRIAHVSPMLGILNQETLAADGEVESPKHQLVRDASLTFDLFINALHDSTLRLPGTEPAGWSPYARATDIPEDRSHGE